MEHTTSTTNGSNGDATPTTTSATDKKTTMRARLLAPTDEALAECAARLRAGHLVSFPTETVYGLGCDAGNPDAALRVFAAKRRPLADPLIVHVSRPEDALRLWSADDDATRRVLEALTEVFFPGPLTLVARADPSRVPDVITAGTGRVACRSPSHPLARRLIEATGRPIAAPSANRFGHVSPTRASHVTDDLGDEDVWVLEEEEENEDERSRRVGVESTVAAVDGEERVVSVLRQGAVSARDLRDRLVAAGLDDVFRVDVRVRTTAEHVANVAPGQTVRHYSPDVPSYLLSAKAVASFDSSSSEKSSLAAAVVLDLGGRLRALSTRCAAYRDLSETGNSAEAAALVFECLRWAEAVPNAERVYLPEIEVDNESDALTLAIKDRLTRAASGMVLDALR